MNTLKIIERAAKEVREGQVINLGIGLPTQIISHLPDNMNVMIHTENGLLGAWKKANVSNLDPNLIDAGGNYITLKPGASFFDSAVSFAIIRRSRLDASFMGAFEVDAFGNLANWKIPGKFSPGIGGAMELAQKTDKVIVLCNHTDKAGKPKIKQNCSLPITGERCVSRIITDMAVIDVEAEGLVLREIAEGLEVEDLLSVTEPPLKIPDVLIRF